MQTHGRSGWCLKCCVPAGGDGGLCKHVFVLLLVLEHFSPRKADCVLPGPQSAMGHLFQEHYPRASDESYL